MTTPGARACSPPGAPAAPSPLPAAAAQADGGWGRGAQAGLEAAVRAAGRGEAGSAPPQRPGPARPAPPGHPGRALTRRAGRPGSRPCSSRRGRAAGPAGRQLRPRCGRGDEPGAVRRSWGRGGRGGARRGRGRRRGRAAGCPPAQWGHAAACGCAPPPAPTGERPGLRGPCLVPPVRSPPGPGARSFLAQPYLFGPRKFSWT